MLLDPGFSSVPLEAPFFLPVTDDTDFPFPFPREVSLAAWSVSSALTLLVGLSCNVVVEASVAVTESMTEAVSGVVAAVDVSDAFGVFPPGV